MDLIQIRIELVKQGKRLVDLHRATGISYGRLVRLMNGYCEPRPREPELIAQALHLNEKDLHVSDGVIP